MYNLVPNFVIVPQSMKPQLPESQDGKITFRIIDRFDDEIVGRYQLQVIRLSYAESKNSPATQRSRPLRRAPCLSVKDAARHSHLPARA
jgi:hypothetical protein